MSHIILFLILLVFLFGICALFFTGYRQFKSKNRHLKYIFFFLAVLDLKLLLNYILLYFKINLTFNSSFQFILYTVSEDVSYLLIFLFPPVFHSILSIPWKKFFDRIAILVLLAAFIIRIMPYFYKAVFPQEYFSINTFQLPEILVGMVTIYIPAAILIHFRSLKQPILRKIAILGLFFYIFVLLDTYFIFYAIFMNSYYSRMIWPGFALYVFWIVFLTVFSNNTISSKTVPAFMDSISDAFVGKYSLTSKEAEIVKWVITGKSNQEIAEHNFLSIKTIKNHIYKIFQKTGVKNRLELTLLVGSNNQESQKKDSSPI